MEHRLIQARPDPVDSIRRRDRDPDILPLELAAGRDPARVRALIEAEFLYQSQRQRRHQTLAALAVTGVIPWAFLIWPSLASAGVRAFAFAGWCSLAVIGAAAALSEVTGYRRLVRCAEDVRDSPRT